ncbi:unnamed protein product, partial [Didymodactylos carnosus]
MIFYLLPIFKLILFYFSTVHAAGPDTSGVTYPFIKNIHVVSMTHLDVGFTNLAANVCSLYFNHHLPAAATLAQQLRDRGGEERFIFTTHPWILLEFFDDIAKCTNERPNKTTIELVTKAIEQGDITYHAHAMTMFVPMMDENLFSFSLSLSAILDKRFNQPRRTAASHKDDMGHPISSVPIFAKNGIKSLHVGANIDCRGADLPPAFMWKHEATNTNLLVMMYNKPTATTPCSADQCVYGGDVVLPGLSEALVYHFTADNTGPPKINDVIHLWTVIKKRYPNAEIQASSLETFTKVLWNYKDQLPIITNEWGSTWIYGIAADPFKLSAFRQISRSLLSLPPSEALFNYSFRLLKNPEHNWGVCIACYLKRENYAFNYNNSEFSTKRNGSDFQFLETGWKEARSYLLPLNSSDPSVIKVVDKALQQIEPMPPDLTGFVSVPLYSNISETSVDASPYFLFQTALFIVGFDYKTGAIIHMQDILGRNISNSSNPLAAIHYTTYSHADFDNFNTQFNPDCGLPCYDFAKPGLENYDDFIKSRTWQPKAVSMWMPVKNNNMFLVELTFPDEIIEDYGASQNVWINYTFPSSFPSVLVELQWFNKTMTRLPESFWIRFDPILSQTTPNTCDQWRIDVMGNDVNPSE